MKRLLTLGLLLVALPASAALYKWVDQDGKVHYSDQPPPAEVKKADVVHAPASSPAPAPSGNATGANPAGGNAPNPASKGPKSPAEQEMDFRRRRLEAAENETRRQQEAQAAEEKKRNCTQARNRVSALETGGRITRYGPDGETMYLSDEQIARELVDARQIADSWCK